MKVIARVLAIFLLLGLITLGCGSDTGSTTSPPPTEEPDLTILPPSPTPSFERVFVVPKSGAEQPVTLTLNNEIVKLPTGDEVRLCGIVSRQGMTMGAIEKDGRVVRLKLDEKISGIPIRFRLPNQMDTGNVAEFVDAPLRGVIQLLSEAARVNVIISGEEGTEFSRRVTLRRSGVPLEKILRQVLSANQIALVEAPDTWLVGKIQNGPPGGRGAEEQMLFHVGQKIPQILLECQVIETTESALREMGILYGSPPGKIGMKLSTGAKVLPSEVVAQLTALAGTGKAEVLARPSVLVLSGEEANIQIGNRVPFAAPVMSGGITNQWRVEYLDAGITLRITPYAGPDRKITISLHPEISSISEWRTTPAGEFPVMSTRKADSLVRVGDQETVMIGGLLSETERENITKLPVLGDIPFIGIPFQNRTKEKVKTEVVFLITPKIQ